MAAIPTHNLQVAVEVDRTESAEAFRALEESVERSLAKAVIGTASPVRVFHRFPDPPSSDRRSPRGVMLDEFMAIRPQAVEQSFFSFFFDDEEKKAYEMVGSVAVVSISGPLMQKGGWWYDGYEAIRGRFEKALADKAVSAIVLKINSPGGVCAGCFSAGRAMRAMKEEARKPVLAYADESAFSAAYAMACIADEIYLPKEGGVGSVGVIGVLEDWTGFNDQMGIKVAVITSGEYKADGHPDVPLTKAVIDRYQKRIDALAGSFAELVGGARGMTPEAVLKLEAACLYGEEAVRAGLANGVATFEQTVAKAQEKALSRGTSARKTMGSMGASKGHAMSTKNENGSGVEVKGELLEVSFAEFALAVGLAHDASKGDILGAIARRGESLTTLLDAHEAKTAAEAIGKLEAERSTYGSLVAAIMGPKANAGDKDPTPEDALKKIAADRKAQELAEVKVLIEQAITDGKVQANGEKAMGIYEKHGIEALKAHIDALVPQPALTGKAPVQPESKSPAAPKATKDGTKEVVLSAEDEAFIVRYEMNRDEFIAARKREVAERADRAASAE